MRKYRIVSLDKNPGYRDKMADWFSSKWHIPRGAYLESMDECLSGKNPVPQWYMVLDGEKIAGGLGVTENDFHDRKDLAPNVCAVFVEEVYRNQGVAGEMLAHVCRDMADRGVRTLYLLTDHASLYERWGWEFLCMVQGDGEPDMSRMYVHREPE